MARGVTWNGDWGDALGLASRAVRCRGMARSSTGSPPSIR